MSPILSVMIQVIQNRTTVKGESDLFTASMITDWIRRQKVLLSIDHKITISEKRRIAKL